MSWNSLLWGHEPMCCVTGALGFALLIARYMRPDSLFWFLTIWSAVLHQICSGTPERAIYDANDPSPSYSASITVPE